MAAFAVAHRGLSSEKTENTVAAFGAAVRAGFPAVEMDLRTTSDGQVIVFHDEDLERLTGKPGLVRETTLAKILERDTKDGGIPPLADVLSTLKVWNGLVNLEFKSVPAVAPSIELVKLAGISGRVLLSSMDPDALTECRRLAPDWPRGFLPIGQVEDEDIHTAKELGCVWVNADEEYLTTAIVKRLRGDGFRVGAWTVNDTARAKELDAMGVDCVITDALAVRDTLPASVTRW